MRVCTIQKVWTRYSFYEKKLSITEFPIKPLEEKILCQKKGSKQILIVMEFSMSYQLYERSLIIKVSFYLSPDIGLYYIQERQANIRHLCQHFVVFRVCMHLKIDLPCLLTASFRLTKFLSVVKQYMYIQLPLFS